RHVCFSSPGYGALIGLLHRPFSLTGFVVAGALFLARRTLAVVILVDLRFLVFEFLLVEGCGRQGPPRPPLLLLLFGGIVGQALLDFFLFLFFLGRFALLFLGILGFLCGIGPRSIGRQAGRAWRQAATRHPAAAIGQ